MDQPVYSTQGDFASHVLRLVSQSNKFLNDMKVIKSLQSGTIGALENVTKAIYSAEVSNVSSIGLDLNNLDTELQKLLNKFYIVQNSYKNDETMASFLGNFNKNPQDAYTKLVSYSDGCIHQIDSVITAYSRVEKGITKASLWIMHILSHTAPESVSKRARDAKSTISELSKVVAQIRDMSHNAKLGLLNLRNLAAKHAKPRTS